jgi:hypothetical protein
VGLLDRPIASKHDHILRRHGPVEGRCDLDHRLSLGQAERHLIAHGTRAAPTRPEHHRLPELSNFCFHACGRLLATGRPASAARSRLCASSPNVIVQRILRTDIPSGAAQLEDRPELLVVPIDHCVGGVVEGLGDDLPADAGVAAPRDLNQRSNRVLIDEEVSTYQPPLAESSLASDTSWETSSHQRASPEV